MLGTVAVTDFGWYEFLSRYPMPEVNFLTPSDRRRFNAPQFSPFFFKLKAPHRAIVGFGYFAKWSSLPSRGSASAKATAARHSVSSKSAWPIFEQGSSTSQRPGPRTLVASFSSNQRSFRATPGWRSRGTGMIEP